MKVNEVERVEKLDKESICRGRTMFRIAGNKIEGTMENL